MHKSDFGYLAGNFGARYDVPEITFVALEKGIIIMICDEYQRRYRPVGHSTESFWGIQRGIGRVWLQYESMLVNLEDYLDNRGNLLHITIIVPVEP